MLLEAVANVEGVEKLRFISPHPKDFTEDVAKVIAKYRNISRNLHYPLQSGSNRILKLMNRKYTKEEYLEKADMIKKHIPDVSFSTDIIVGFPTETEEDFEDTLDVVKKMEFEQIFMFIYSKRTGTPAATMEGQISKEVSQDRFKRLQEIYEKQVIKKNDEYIGRIINILIEEETGEDGSDNLDRLKGRTDSNKVVIIPKYDNYHIGDKIDVEILENRKWYLKGRKVGGY